MKRSIVTTMLALLWAGGALAGGSGSSATTADGLIRFDPPQSLGCVAVRVEVPAQQMLTGVRWWNGSASLALPKILVASGSGMEPPAYAEAVIVAEGVSGSDSAWSTAEFGTPIASISGTLFVILQYPPDFVPATGGPQLGVGWSEEEALYTHFVTGDGETWIKVASQCRVLVEPVLDEAIGGVTMLRGSDQTPARTDEVGLTLAPNPFNPETHVDLYLAAATTGTVRVFDLRGRLVAELHHGPLQAGHNPFVWNGVDSNGRPVASGVYSVLAETPDQRHVQKAFLVK
ncbi:MAG: hypothetical protein IPH48_12735 [bacterium]|jgi:hypothetical protein|nr:hypothetical protein [bacterium]